MGPFSGQRYIQNLYDERLYDEWYNRRLYAGSGTTSSYLSGSLRNGTTEASIACTGTTRTPLMSGSMVSGATSASMVISGTTSSPR